MQFSKKTISFITIIALVVTMCVCPIMSHNAYAEDKADDKKIASMGITTGTYGKFTFTPNNPKVGNTVNIKVEGNNMNADWSTLVGQKLYIPQYIIAENGLNRKLELAGTHPNLYYGGVYFPKALTNSVTVYYNEYTIIIKEGKPTIEDPADRSVQEKFSLKAANKKIKVTLVGNKGKIGKKKSYNKSINVVGKYGKLKTPKRKGYKFLGWYTTKDNWGVKVTKNSKVKSMYNHKLYAKWAGPVGKGKTITKKEFNRIKVGMKYSEVKLIVGGKGKLIYQSDRYMTYRWQRADSKYIGAYIRFDNGYVYSKSW